MHNSLRPQTGVRFAAQMSVRLRCSALSDSTRRKLVLRVDFLVMGEVDTVGDIIPFAPRIWVEGLVL